MTQNGVTVYKVKKKDLKNVFVLSLFSTVDKFIKNIN